jgi:putative endonuclease
MRGCPEPYKEEQIEKELIRVTDRVFICKKCQKELEINEFKKDLIGKTESSEESSEESNEEKINTIEDKIIEETDIKIDDEILEIEKEVKKEVKKDKNVKQKTDVKDDDEILEIEKEVKKDKNVEQKTEIKDEFFAYVVKCRDNTFYSGVTSNLEKCVKMHNKGSGGKYTEIKNRRPVVLVYSRQTKTLEEAKKLKVDIEKEYKDSIGC